MHVVFDNNYRPRLYIHHPHCGCLLNLPVVWRPKQGNMDYDHSVELVYNFCGPLRARNQMDERSSDDALHIYSSMEHA